MNFASIIKLIILPFITSFGLSIILYPIYIKVAIKKRLFDFPEQKRKEHIRPIPSMGGFVMFIVTFFTLSFFYPSDSIHFYKYFFSSALIFFSLGIKDDIIGVSPVKKLLLNFAVAFIMIFVAHQSITSFYGLFGDVHFSKWVFFLVSLLFYTTLINSFNLIDGIDGLATCISTFVLICYAFLFYFLKDSEGLIISVIVTACLLSFLMYNFPPARLFMGDTGSIFIGFVVTVLSIKLLENTLFREVFKGIYAPLLILSIIIYPILDLLRVFCIRILKGESPIKADNIHIHHVLRQVGFSKETCILIILSFSIISVFIVYLLKFQSNLVLLSVYFSYISACLLALQFFKIKRI